MFDLCTIVALLWYTSKAQYKSLINNNNNVERIKQMKNIKVETYTIFLSLGNYSERNRKMYIDETTLNFKYVKKNFYVAIEQNLNIFWCNNNLKRLLT